MKGEKLEKGYTPLSLSFTVFFIVYKGAKGLDLDETSLETAFAYALGLGIGLGVIMIPTVLPYIKRRIDTEYNEDGTQKPVRYSKKRKASYVWFKALVCLLHSTALLKLKSRNSYDDTSKCESVKLGCVEISRMPCSTVPDALERVGNT